jgi:hypothetical protein
VLRICQSEVKGITMYSIYFFIVSCKGLHLESCKVPTRGFAATITRPLSRDHFYDVSHIFSRFPTLYCEQSVEVFLGWLWMFDRRIIRYLFTSCSGDGRIENHGDRSANWCHETTGKDSQFGVFLALTQHYINTHKPRLYHHTFYHIPQRSYSSPKHDPH